MKTSVEKPDPHLLSWLLTLALAASPAAHALLAVANVSAAQRSDSKLVDIDFDVTGTTTPVTVSLDISADGGTSWTVPATTTTGAIGSNITPGAGLRIIWNAGTDWNNQQSTQMLFRIGVITSTGFALIPAGTFTMGDTLDNDTNAPPHAVTVSSFHMQKTEVSKSQWTDVREWAVHHGYKNISIGAGKATTHPVEKVTWHEVVKWCNALSEKEGLTPCYHTDAALTKVYRYGITNINNTMVNWSANGYRLPTEAEWEMAARGGLSGKRFPWGDTITHSQANYFSSTNNSYDVSPTRGLHPTYNKKMVPYTSPVGSFAANGYGLYDMAGNVREWCWDRYDAAYYATSPATDPHGPDTGANRVLRGGDWSYYANGCRVAYRYTGGVPNITYNRFGFRPVHTHDITAVSPDTSVDTRESLLVAGALSNGAIGGSASDGTPGFIAHCALVPSEGIIRLSFPAQQDQSYTVEASTDLNKWDPVESNIIGQGGDITRSYPTGDIPRRFFRVRKN